MISSPSADGTDPTLRRKEDSLEKKQWQTPQLISLVRRDPQEAVLVVCKTLFGGGGSDPSDWYAGCLTTWPDNPSMCQPCYEEFDS
jgi:hypothetical protein